MINRQISVNYISAYVKVCANYMYMMELNFVAKTRSVDFICLITVFICLASVIVGFGYFSIVRPLK